MKISLIVCADKNGGIGKSGKLLFPLKEDMKFFKRMTVNRAVIMGRKTFDSLPGGAPLKDRVNIVLTKNPCFRRKDVIVCRSAAEALAEAEKFPEAMVIGGEQIYKTFLPYCKKAYVTKVDAEKDADAYFPDLDSDNEWILTGQSETFEENGVNFSFYVYERKYI